MTEIRPIVDPNEQEALAARCHAPHIKNSLAYAAFSEGIPHAICEFGIPTPYAKNQTARLLSLGYDGSDASKEIQVLRFLLIGVLSFCIENGCTSFEYADGLPNALPETLGFTQNADGLYGYW